MDKEINFHTCVRLFFDLWNSMCLGSRIRLLMYFALKIVDVNKLLNIVVYFASAFNYPAMIWCSPSLGWRSRVEIKSGIFQSWVAPPWRSRSAPPPWTASWMRARWKHSWNLQSYYWWRACKIEPLSSRSNLSYSVLMHTIYASGSGGGGYGERPHIKEPNGLDLGGESA